jgi:hypothetical protein
MYVDLRAVDTCCQWSIAFAPCQSRLPVSTAQFLSSPPRRGSRPQERKTSLSFVRPSFGFSLGAVAEFLGMGPTPPKN